jgi:hypothetical protein
MPRKIAMAALLAALLGCEAEMDDERPIDVEKVPASVLKVAKDEMPGVDFERAWTGKSGGEMTYEIRGTTEDGKVREIRITASGQVLERE